MHNATHHHVETLLSCDEEALQEVDPALRRGLLTRLEAALAHISVAQPPPQSASVPEDLPETVAMMIRGRAWDALRSWLASALHSAETERENRAKETDRAVMAQRWARRWKEASKNSRANREAAKLHVETLDLLTIALARAERAEEALRRYFPPGSWCPKCGQGLHDPNAKPCADRERGCDAARSVLSRIPPSQPGATPAERDGAGRPEALAKSNASEPTPEIR